MPPSSMHSFGITKILPVPVQVKADVETGVQLSHEFALQVILPVLLAHLIVRQR